MMSGIEGPQMSMSMIAVCVYIGAVSSYDSHSHSLPLTCVSRFVAQAQASIAVKVLLPTPPLPLMMRTLFLTPFMRSAMRGKSGSGPFGVLAHTPWLGQPSQALALPACSDSVPGQCSGAFSGTASGSARAMASGASAVEGGTADVNEAVAVGAMMMSLRRRGEKARSESKVSSRRDHFLIAESLSPGTPASLPRSITLKKKLDKDDYISRVGSTYLQARGKLGQRGEVDEVLTLGEDGAVVSPAEASLDQPPAEYSEATSSCRSFASWERGLR